MDGDVFNFAIHAQRFNAVGYFLLVASHDHITILEYYMNLTVADM